MSSFEEIVREAIERVAPDVDAQVIPSSADFREWAELDSMDFLGVLEAVSAMAGVEVPERDYAAISTVESFASYLASRTQDAR